MPQQYSSALEQKVQAVEDMRKSVKEAGLDGTNKRDLQSVIQEEVKGSSSDPKEAATLPPNYAYVYFSQSP
eukprot:6728993-Pyramimonas_sp.AAC.2